MRRALAVLRRVRWIVDMTTIDPKATVRLSAEELAKALAAEPETIPPVGEIIAIVEPPPAPAGLDVDIAADDDDYEPA